MQNDEAYIIMNIFLNHKYIHEIRIFKLGLDIKENDLVLLT